jgi:YidC/Oxa1 family membrane protein insertase
VDFLSLTQSNWFLVGPVAKVLGVVMNGIYEFLDMFGIASIGLAIILFTIIIKALMLPLSIKQQKFTKLNSIMAPELQQVQKKYANLDKSSPKYNEMLLKQNEEMKEVYAKYGTSPTGGCVQMLIQMPILFALYQVIYKIPGYITKVRAFYEPIVEALQNIPTYMDNADFVTLAQQNGINAAGLSDSNKLIDLLYNFDKTEWTKFTEIFPNLNEYVAKALPSIEKANYFLGMDLATAPAQQLWPGVLIPILAGLTQWLSSKMMQTDNGSNKNSDDTMGSTMKTMNIMMPLMSVFFCFTFSAGIGVYWIASSVVMILIQMIVNKYMERIDINQMVEKNIEKANVKRVKKGQKPLKAKAVMNVRTIEEERELEEKKEAELKERVTKQVEKSTEYYSTTQKKKGKLASKAGMVQQYNEKSEKKNRK